MIHTTLVPSNAGRSSGVPATTVALDHLAEGGAVHEAFVGKAVALPKRARG